MTRETRELDPYQREPAGRGVEGSWRGAGVGPREALNSSLRSLGFILELWEPREKMVGLCIPGVIVELKAGDRGPVERLV